MLVSVGLVFVEVVSVELSRSIDCVSCSDQHMSGHGSPLKDFFRLGCLKSLDNSLQPAVHAHCNDKSPLRCNNILKLDSKIKFDSNVQVQ